MRQSQGSDAGRNSRNQGAHFIARCSAKLIGECTQQTLGFGKAQHLRQDISEQCRFRHRPAHQIVGQEINRNLFVYHRLRFATQHIHVQRDYDALLRPTRITSQALGVNGAPQAPTGTIIQDTELTYNDVSNIIKRQTEYGLYNYGYDDLDRLTQVVPPSVIPNISTPLPIEGYTYDAVHNRQTSLHQTGSLTNAWQYNAHHQLTQYGEPSATLSSSLASIVHPKVTQTFDANGHLISKVVAPEDTSPAGIQAGKQSHRYTVSVSERLLQTNDSSGNEIARYAYDPFGRRIIKTVSQNVSGQGAQIGTTAYFYSDEGLIAEVDGINIAGSITTTYGWMPSGTWGTAPLFKRDHAGQSGTPLSGQNAVEHYYHHDHLGTPQRLTNHAGETTWRAVSEAFGKTIVDATLAPTSTGATINNLRFPGQYEDGDTGTRQNYFRDYSPVVGRYLQTDPIGLGGGVNTYGYARSSPARYLDSKGLQSYFPEDLTQNTTVCDGAGSVTAQIGTPQNLSCGLGECIRAHEEQHIRDLKNAAYARNVCLNKAARERVGFNTVCKSYRSEVAASDVELVCLRGKQNGCTDECRSTLDGRIAQIEAYRRENQRKAVIACTSPN